MTASSNKGLSYKDAGVDIAAADAFVGNIGALARATHTAGVVPGRGEYASLFRPNLKGLSDPLIAATCDGVGTKLLVAKEMGLYRGLGQDLVAMNVNDLLPVGARPLLFLDYIATGALQPEVLTQVVAGIASACEQVGCALLGGETAEMPGLYAKGDFDLAGFAVGLLDGARAPQPQSLAEGDVIFALPSSGVHSNGLSLARKALLQRGALSLSDTPSKLSRSVGQELLEPTALYVRQVLRLMETVQIKTAAHVTGGGLLGRSERLATPGLRLRIDPTCYKRPAIFELIAQCGAVTPLEMAKTFNMGLGYLVVVAASQAPLVEALHEDGWLRVGEVVGGTKGADLGYAAS